MDEIESGRQKFMELVKEIDPKVETVIPVRATNNNFLISLTKGKARKFITVSEDDIVDLVEDDEIRQMVEDIVREAVEAIKAT